MYIPKILTTSARVLHHNIVKTADEDSDCPQKHSSVSREFLNRRSNVQRMEHAAQVYLERAAYTMASADPTLISRDALLGVIETQVRRVYGCLSLPFTFIFFLLFAFCANLHEDITNVYLIENGLHKEFESAHSVSTLPDLINWLNVTFISTMFANEMGSTPKKINVLGYNYLVGSVVLEQTRSKEVNCSDVLGSLDRQALFSNMKCYPFTSMSDSSFGHGNMSEAEARVQDPQESDYAGGTADRTTRLQHYGRAFEPWDTNRGKVGRRLRIMLPTSVERLLPKSDFNFRANFWANTPQRLWQEHMNYLLQRSWLDKQTKQVSIQALLLNAEVGRARLEKLTIRFALSRGGEIHSQLILDSLIFGLFLDWRSVVADIMWVCALVFITWKTIHKTWCQFRQGNLIKSCCSLWTILQCVIIAVGWACVIVLCITWYLMEGVTREYEKVVDAQDRDIPADIQHVGEGLHESAASVIGIRAWYRTMIGQYHLVLMLRFFTAFKAQPRLGVVVGTLENCFVDVIHFLVVLLPTFCAYAVAGCFIFGRRMEEFSSYQRALGECFKMLTEGEYDWPALAAEHYWTAAFWTWTFMLLLVLLMLNMVLAIVLDVYTDMRKRLGQSESVWATFVGVLLRIRFRRVWISGKELMEGVSCMPPMISREDLLQTFSKMCPRQADLLVTACRHENDIKSVRTDGKSHVMKMAVAAKLSVDKVSAEIHKLEQCLLDTQTSPPKGDESWLAEVARETHLQNHWLVTIQWKLQQLHWNVQALRALHGAKALANVQHDTQTQQRIFEL